MIRNTILYHRLWYIRKRNLRRMQVYIPVILFVIAVTFTAVYLDKRVLPEILEISETKAQEEIYAAINDTVENDFQDELKYENLMLVVKDENERISAIQKNTDAANSASLKISAKIEEKLSYLSGRGIRLPYSKVVGDSMISVFSPDFHIRMRPYGDVKTVINSEINSVPDGRIRCVLTLEVRATVLLRLAFYERKKEIITSIPISDNMITRSGSISQE